MPSPPSAETGGPGWSLSSLQELLGGRYRFSRGQLPVPALLPTHGAPLASQWHSVLGDMRGINMSLS